MIIRAKFREVIFRANLTLVMVGGGGSDGPPLLYSYVPRVIKTKKRPIRLMSFPKILFEKISVKNRKKNLYPRQCYFNINIFGITYQ